MPSQKPHIVFVCSRLDQPGGTERAIVNLANLFEENGHRVSLLILDETAECFYKRQTRIDIIHADLKFGITKKGNKLLRKLDFYRHVRQLKKMLSQLAADVIIGTEYYLSIVSWLAARKSESKIISWEHHHINWLKKNIFWTLLFNKVYPKLDLVVCQNTTEQKLFNELGSNTVVIPYVLPEEQKEKAKLGKKNLLTIGWLIKRKGVDLIPPIAEKIFERHKDWHWKIIGKGEEYDWLHDQIKEKNLDKNLSIAPPVSDDIKNEYLNTSIYVMTSRFECLPMVLLEASSFGIPLVAFNCPTGPADIIHHEKDGFLVPLEDIDAMANAIVELMEDEEKRKVMGTHAVESSKRYGAEGIYGLWRELFNRT